MPSFKQLSFYARVGKRRFPWLTLTTASFQSRKVRRKKNERNICQLVQFGTRSKFTASYSAEFWPKRRRRTGLTSTRLDQTRSTIEVSRGVYDIGRKYKENIENSLLHVIRNALARPRRMSTLLGSSVTPCVLGYHPRHQTLKSTVLVHVLTSNGWTISALRSTAHVRVKNSKKEDGRACVKNAEEFSMNDKVGSPDCNIGRPKNSQSETLRLLHHLQQSRLDGQNPRTELSHKRKKKKNRRKKKTSRKAQITIQTARHP